MEVKGVEQSKNVALSSLSGVGPVRSGKLAKLGLERLSDVLWHFPLRYEDRRKVYTVREAPEGQTCCVKAMVAQPPQLSRVRSGIELVKVRCVDDTGVLNLAFFHQSYLRHTFSPGDQYVFYGKVEKQGRGISMVNPLFEKEGEEKYTGRIVPVYPLTAGIHNALLMSLAQLAVEQLSPTVEEVLPLWVREEYHLCQQEFALQNIHFPQSFEGLEWARRRLIFEELLTLTCGLAMLKGRRQQFDGLRLEPHSPKEFQSLLPFTPTDAQRRAMEDIFRDVTSGQSMNRLVQGDVGSGKTAVAAYGAWVTALSGMQCALMAPTELLAEQHYRTLSTLLGPSGIRVELLTGSVKGAGRKKLLQALASGEVQVLVGTHALFSQGVEYHRLGLVIADEQHRFGVAQRGALAAKGGEIPPHVLVMSATPIPRTLALMIYGDMEVSIIDQLPPGRTPVSTYVVGEDKRQRMYGFVRTQVGQGRQVYLVCPAVEENGGEDEEGQTSLFPAMDLKAVTTYAKHLQEQVFPDLKVGFVHGKMKSKDKEAIMSAFAAGEIQVLVSTTVIEVGVDVPNATLMIVENADRFGLSQLHQLRGRVGRGKHESYCVLVTASRSETARQRLRVLAQTTDGFQIAQEDLRLRGPGDFFGQRQHGLPQLKVADFASDLEVLNQARQAAQTLVEGDPDLTQAQHLPLRRRVEHMFRDNPDIFH